MSIRKFIRNGWVDIYHYTNDGFCYKHISEKLVKCPEQETKQLIASGMDPDAAADQAMENYLEGVVA